MGLFLSGFIYIDSHSHGTNMCVHNVCMLVSLTMKHKLTTPTHKHTFAVHTNSFEMFVADSLVEKYCMFCVDF